jgi:hypothetical protein
MLSIVLVIIIIVFIRALGLLSLRLGCAPLHVGGRLLLSSLFKGALLAVAGRRLLRGRALPRCTFFAGHRRRM